MDKATRKAKDKKDGLEWKMGNLYQKAVDALNRGKTVSEEEFVEKPPAQTQPSQVPPDPQVEQPPIQPVIQSASADPKPPKDEAKSMDGAAFSKHDAQNIPAPEELEEDLSQLKSLQDMDSQQKKPEASVPKLSEEEVFQRNRSTITFNLFFSADKMNAYIRAQNYQKGSDADNRIPTEVIYDLLKGKGVTFGIDHSGIEEYCKGRTFYKDFQAAIGSRPENGQNGTVEYLFSLDMTYAPKERDDGTVDYKELDLIRNVAVGDALCRVHQPTDGVDGMDVFGTLVKAQAGQSVEVNAGKGVELSEDGITYVASISGMVELNKGVLEVKDVYTINGDVGPATGNIRFGGAVVVKGSVLSDYAIYAGGDILINGYVESSILNSSGNIVIKNGISGTKKGLLKADGDVTVRFAEMARIVAGGSFRFDYCINCDVRVREDIIGKGKRASLLGGNYIAGRKIDVNVIGSDLNIPMDAQIIPNWQEVTNLKVKPEERLRENKELAHQFEQDYNALKRKFERIETDVARLARKNSMDTKEEAESKQKKVLVLMRQKAAIREQMSYIDEKREKLKRLSANEESMIVVRKIVHVGVRLTIGNAMMWVNDPTDHQTFINDQGLIEGHGITPGSV
ncbi:DUF342 domain-containing protein [Aminipila butyrica]|uniref:DUF342 domain-containing protein n=1 Tax=Aminipila butyrica TaxID=433296 RepID=A0A858BWE8_9FIRM|nr:FapA family protein [Aminipila butyrica]QIB68406.1 DUF342 domain-containing protein [Aminipila butyrica]